MGDLQAWLQPQPTGVLTEESPSQSSNPHPLSIGAESWRWAEQATRQIIYRIQPTAVSEQRRKDVVDYVQRLIRGLLSSEVFPFGSVPLKTYLPDGDIDLTALSYQKCEDALANDVRGVLEGEEQNKHAEFEVKDVQYIHAEVFHSYAFSSMLNDFIFPIFIRILSLVTYVWILTFNLLVILGQLLIGLSLPAFCLDGEMSSGHSNKVAKVVMNCINQDVAKAVDAFSLVVQLELDSTLTLLNKPEVFSVGFSWACVKSQQSDLQWIVLGFGLSIIASGPISN